MMHSWKADSQTLPMLGGSFVHVHMGTARGALEGREKLEI